MPSLRVPKPIRHSRHVRKELSLPGDIDRQLQVIAKQAGETSDDVFRKALWLYIAAYDNRRLGMRLGFARQDQPLVMEVVGL